MELETREDSLVVAGLLNITVGNVSALNVGDLDGVRNTSCLGVECQTIDAGSTRLGIKS